MVGGRKIICKRQHVARVVVGVTEILNVAARDEGSETQHVRVVRKGGGRAALKDEISELVGGNIFTLTAHVAQTNLILGSTDKIFRVIFNLVNPAKLIKIPLFVCKLRSVS